MLIYVLLPVFVLGLAMCFHMPVEGGVVKRIKDVSRIGAREEEEAAFSALVTFHSEQSSSSCVYAGLGKILSKTI